MNSTVPAIPAGLFNYDANDRLTTDAYDDNGNTTVNASIANTYDFENHLIQRGAITVAYDGDGNRVSKTAGGVTTRYLVDTNNLTAYAQVLEEIQSGSVVRSYVYGLDLIGQKLGASSFSFYGYDGHGSVRFLTDSTGAITDTYDYDAFGNLINRIGATNNNYLYAGEQFDPDLNLYYNRARYLDVRVGRFWTVDTFEGIAEDPKSLHKYLYAGNRPTDFSDPSGNEFSVSGVLTALNIAAFVLNTVSGVYHAYKSFTAETEDERNAHRLAAYGDATGALLAFVGAGGGSLGPRLAAVGGRGLAQIGLIATEGRLLERAATFTASVLFFVVGNSAGSGPSSGGSPQVQLNNQSGRAAAKKFLDQLRQNGINVLGEEIYVKTPFGTRIPDGVAEVNGRLIGIEVKSGGGRRTALQFLKDMYINHFGGQAFGTNAAQAGITHVDRMITVFVP